MVDLITYLQQAIKNKSKLVNKPTKKQKKRPRVARRGLGFGMRHRNYKNYKDNKKENINSQLITLLTGIFKNMNPKNSSEDRSLNPFLEKEKQNYSMTFEPRVKNIEEKLLSIESKDENIQKNMKAIKNVNMTEINNKLADYEIKWTDLIENQDSLIQEINDIEVGNMGSHIQDRFRNENLDNKSEILSLQRELQEDINNAEDLNDYKSFIDFQNKVLNNSVDNFVEVDNRISQELKDSKIGFEELQKITESEKIKLKVDLENNQEKVLQLSSDLNDVSSAYKKTRDKLQEYEISNPTPPRLEVKISGESDDEEFKPPSPKPIRKLSPEEKWFIDYIKGAGSLSAKRYKEIGRMFGEDKVDFYKKTTSGEAKRTRLKQLLIESGIDETNFKKTL
tara:strand:+ start:2719 stop:3900 length:1182 start_codon:yes stop_codon:yes gene_type:complete